MNTTVQKKILFCVLVFFVVYIAATVIQYLIFRKQSSVAPVIQALAPLPEDVENIMKGYTYSETHEGLQVKISGKQIIRRGKKILGLRSNLIKSNFFEDINGTVVGPKGMVTFSASDAEWDADTTHPLALKRNVVVIVNGKTLSHVRVAKIFFNQGTIEVTTDRIKVYNFK